jgi:hypothetical protein
VTLEEVIDHFSALARDPDCPDHLDVLLGNQHDCDVEQRVTLRCGMSFCQRRRLGGLF